MVSSAGDLNWSSAESVKTLILEHSLAAMRHGFDDFFQAFEGDESLRKRVFNRDQASSGIVNFLGTQFLPLVRAIVEEDSTAIEKLLREHSPLLSEEAEARDAETRVALVTQLRDAVTQVRNAARVQGQRIRLPLEAVHRTNLLALPDTLAYVVTRSKVESVRVEDESDQDSAIASWQRAVDVALEQIQRFYEYITGNAPFDTHQGVKGLEFPRVMVVLDDNAAGGFLFSYGKLFGTTAESKTDLDNSAAGRETASVRTLRLFYVVCSRAKESLAIVLYTADPLAAKTAAISRGWLAETEIIFRR